MDKRRSSYRLLSLYSLLVFILLANAGCRSLVKESIEDVKPGLSAAVAEIMDEAFDRMAELQQQAEAREESYRQQRDLVEAINKRLDGCEESIKHQGAHLEKTAAGSNSLKEEVHQQLPLVWRRMSEHASTLESKITVATDTLDGRISEDSNLLKKDIADRGTALTADIRILGNSVREEIQGVRDFSSTTDSQLASKLDMETRDLRQSLTLATRALSEETHKLGTTLREERRDLMYLVGAIVAVGSLVVTLVSAARGRAQKEER